MWLVGKILIGNGRFMMVSVSPGLAGLVAKLENKDSVASTVLHPMGTVAATCSGQRHYPDDGTSDDEGHPASVAKADNTLKVWSMPFLETQPDR